MRFGKLMIKFGLFMVLLYIGIGLWQWVFCAPVGPPSGPPPPIYEKAR
jgi:hypothetical protein